MDPLNQFEAHLWYLALAESDESSRSDLHEEARALLPAAELERCQRFSFEAGRRECLSSRILVRKVLSRYVDVKPNEWSFETGAFGKPAIRSPEGTGLCFNLSHTRGLLACLVSRDREVGVDVERLDRESHGIETARRYFSVEEVAAFEQLPLACRQEGFLKYWTLKEAYIKARGMGLQLPLDQFTLKFADENAIQIGFDPRLQDDPASWTFGLLRPTTEHQLAYAIRRRPGELLKIVERGFLSIQKKSENPSGTTR